jgi:hypothetical protein
MVLPRGIEPQRALRAKINQEVRRTLYKIMVLPRGIEPQRALRAKINQEVRRALLHKF